MAANIDAIKVDANNATKNLVGFLRKQGLVGESITDLLRDFRDTEEEVTYNAALSFNDLARRLASI